MKPKDKDSDKGYEGSDKIMLDNIRHRTSLVVERANKLLKEQGIPEITDAQEEIIISRVRIKMENNFRETVTNYAEIECEDYFD